MTAITSEFKKDQLSDAQLETDNNALEKHLQIKQTESNSLNNQESLDSNEELAQA